MGLIANNITFKYFENAKKNTISNLDIILPEGTITVLSGKSGSGKSTLAYVLAGLYPENAGFLLDGEVLWMDHNIHELTPDQRVQYVAMMFQNADLQFCMNYLEQELDFCFENIRLSKEEQEIRIEHVIHTLGIQHLLRRPFHTMSGGEKQLCALACIFALDSRCIILDEAFANIDVATARKIIRILKESGKTVLAIDHQVSLWESVMDCHLKFEELSLDLDCFVKDTRNDVIDALPRPCHCEHKRSNPEDNQTSSHLDCVAKNTPTNITDPILTINDIMIRDIAYPPMQFHKGSITAVMGPSGCGKTSLFQTIIGQTKYQGHITLLQKSLKKWKRNALFQICGIVFQNPSNQFLALSVYDEIYYSVNQWNAKQPEVWKKQRTLELLELFGLKRYQRYSPYLLSQGQQRRLAVLTMLAGEQEILLLDEPTYGQDGENIKAMMQLLLERAKDGLTIIFTTHNEQVAFDYANHIIRLE